MKESDRLRDHATRYLNASRAMSLKADRDRLREMARQTLAEAERLDAEVSQRHYRPAPEQHVHHAQQQQQPQSDEKKPDET
jgi:hypothetical protein